MLHTRVGAWEKKKVCSFYLFFLLRSSSAPPPSPVYIQIGKRYVLGAKRLVKGFHGGRHHEGRRRQERFVVRVERRVQRHEHGPVLTAIRLFEEVPVAVDEGGWHAEGRGKRRERRCCNE